MPVAIKKPQKEIEVTPAMHDYPQEHPFQRGDCCGYLVKIIDPGLTLKGKQSPVLSIKIVNRNPQLLRKLRNALVQQVDGGVRPAGVGSVAPCLVGGNVMFFDGNDYIYNGMLTVTQGAFTAPTATVSFASARRIPATAATRRVSPARRCGRSACRRRPFVRATCWA